MGFRRGLSPVAASLGLVICGVAGAVAWRNGLWGLLTGAMVAALWLAALNAWTAIRPRAVTPPATVTRADADARAVRLLLDAAPTPLVGIEGTTARTLNRAARRLFATDDRILPPPAALTDPVAARLHHEGRGWRIDRVLVTDGRSVAALIDIEQEERVAEARASADMIQVLGHELLNGLAPIVSLAESGAAAVARPELDSHLLREILGTLARRAEGLQRFTEAYRALARLPEPSRQAVRLGALADDLARLFAGRWPDASLTIAVEPALDWSLDRDQIGQALWALLQNAVEAADGGARVALRMHGSGVDLAIEVEDHGPGVPPEAAARIFRPFHTSKPEGTGIGLSLARQIALAHGGTLTLGAGRPTLFRMTLPPG
jgi:signal transduction histidine kinase